MRFFLFTILFVLLLPVKAQEATDASMLIKINDALNFYDFEQMRSFIFKNGDRQTYCPSYTDNPHFEIKDMDLEIYLNPSAGNESNPKELDYSIMYIISRGGEIPFNYYLYLTDRRDVYLYDYNQYLSDEFVRKRVLEELNSILVSMKKEMKLID